MGLFDSVFITSFNKMLTYWNMLVILHKNAFGSVTLKERFPWLRLIVLALTQSYNAIKLASNVITFQTIKNV